MRIRYRIIPGSYHRCTCRKEESNSAAAVAAEAGCYYSVAAPEAAVMRITGRRCMKANRTLKELCRNCTCPEEELNSAAAVATEAVKVAGCYYSVAVREAVGLAAGLDLPAVEAAAHIMNHMSILYRKSADLYCRRMPG